MGERSETRHTYICDRCSAENEVIAGSVGNALKGWSTISGQTTPGRALFVGPGVGTYKIFLCAKCTTGLLDWWQSGHPATVHASATQASPVMPVMPASPAPAKTKPKAG